jgi:hypothetical protein
VDAEQARGLGALAVRLTQRAPHRGRFEGSTGKGSCHAAR